MSYTFASYDVSFRAPWRTARGELTERKGFLVYDRDMRGLAEAVVLPEFGTETLADAQRCLLKQEACAAPAASFAIKCAARTTRSHEKSRVRVARMLELRGDRADVRNRCAALLDDGFPIVKCKLGTLDLSEETSRLREILREFSELRVRLDANLAFTREQMLHFWSEINSARIEFVEDPCPFVAEEWAALRAAGMRIACDEPANDIDPIVLNECCDVLVLKPARYGSPENALGAARAWNALGKEAVISSLLESHVGLCQLAALAAELDQPQSVHGLGMTDLFVDELLPDAALLADGCLRCASPNELFELLPRDWQEKLR